MIGSMSKVRLLGAACLVTPAIQAKQPELRADLDGRPIDPAQASSYFCHDFEFPQIHCFSTPFELEAAVSQPVQKLCLCDSCCGDPGDRWFARRSHSVDASPG